jgi:hypothetical protein
MVDKYHCRFHPNEKAVLYCEKYEYGYCRGCLTGSLACPDPELYCKFRTHCIVWETCREAVKQSRAR